MEYYFFVLGPGEVESLLVPDKNNFYLVTHGICTSRANKMIKAKVLSSLHINEGENGRLKLNYIRVKKKLTLLETFFESHRVNPQM